MNTAERLHAKGIQRKHLFVLVTAFVILLVLFFDLFEIAVGRFLWLINPLRPQIGRLWDEDQKDVDGAKEADSIVPETSSDSLVAPRFYNLHELHALLQERSGLTMNRKQFLELYRTLPADQAREMLDPLVLYDLDRNSNWQTARFTSDGEQLAVFFLDAYRQLLLDSYVNIKSAVRAQDDVAFSTLEQQPQFQERVFPARIFYDAFDQLSKSYRLQIINDPLKLVQWGDQLKFVAISRYVENGAVDIGFEMIINGEHNVYNSRASEVAVAYLIEKINGLAPERRITLPEAKEVDHESF